ncbi:glycosyltransferase family 4 protein [Mycobacterium sp. TNTM28]|uniref:Glycosyltransferase family 4 protein n=2 Tax=[Mycobacterium] fortunisiensis TaxID=2600579 RepID=A0ABS6KT04_9MYCO|nr:glycosyltransferase family 4 protein [[Mycobacterium] fortunisiensis]
MATVMRLLLDDPDPRFVLTAVPTFIDAGMPARLWTGVRGMAIATALILCGRTDVVHVHLAHGGSVVRKSLPLMAARLRGIPAIVHGHSFDFSGWLDPLPAPIRRLVRVALRADHWLVLGATLAEQYRRSLALPGHKVEVLHNPVVLPEIAPARDPSSRPLTVLSLGRVGQRKGTYDLLAAVAGLPADVRAQLRVVIAGDGEVAQVRALVTAGGLDDVIEIHDWVGPVDRDRLLQRADIFALPSHDEGLPMAILEAMAHGVVPVSTPVGAIPEAVVDGVTGLLVPPGEPAALAAALQRLTTDDALRCALADSARHRAEAFDVADWRARLATLWLSLSAPQHG